MEKIKRLANSLKYLPSIGEKTAERLAFEILKMPSSKALEIAEAIKIVKNEIKQCPICGLYTENSICEICSDAKRDKTIILVISRAKDFYIFENNKKLNYNGTYHVLNGFINDKTSVSELNIETLLKRIEKFNIKEIILAINPTIGGELTIQYIANKILKNKKITITRLAYGLPAGGDIEFADNFTILEAVNGRKKIKCS
ncbi:MAG: recombination protein RecR [Bacilli bacterium]|nr:recombination protein RecR [Bacilli bacterium]